MFFGNFVSGIWQPNYASQWEGMMNIYIYVYIYIHTYAYSRYKQHIPSTYFFSTVHALPNSISNALNGHSVYPFYSLHFNCNASIPWHRHEELRLCPWTASQLYELLSFEGSPVWAVMMHLMLHGLVRYPEIPRVKMRLWKGIHVDEWIRLLESKVWRILFLSS